MEIQSFKQLIHQKGTQLYRDMPWRRETKPYYILVSELMLQQTQVERVIPKFESFMIQFPDMQSLAKASLAEVLGQWQGLGYNRRAKFLYQASQMIVNDYNGLFPDTYESLLKLPGVGKGTAGAIMVYAYNKPVLFIETNVRTVYFHHFFNPLEEVHDSQIIPLLEQTVDQQNPRQFYWALMDYGSSLKRQGIKNIGQSKHYKKQSKLDGSVRQIRGQIIKVLAESSKTEVELERLVDLDERFDLALSSLVKDGMVEYKSGQWQLASN